MIRKQLKAGQLFTYNRHVYQVTKKSLDYCNLTAISGMCVFCIMRLPLDCYPKLIK